MRKTTIVPLTIKVFTDSLADSIPDDVSLTDVALPPEPKQESETYLNFQNIFQTSFKIVTYMDSLIIYLI